MTIRPENAYFFGIWRGNGPLHCLYDFSGKRVDGIVAAGLFPFQYGVLDGGLLPDADYGSVERVVGRRFPVWFRGPLDATFTAEVDVTKEGNGWHAPSVWTVDVLDVRPVSLAICAETIDVCTMSAASVECLREWCHDWLVDAGVDFVLEELIQGAGL